MATDEECARQAEKEYNLIHDNFPSTFDGVIAVAIRSAELARQEEAKDENKKEQARIKKICTFPYCEDCTQKKIVSLENKLDGAECLIRLLRANLPLDSPLRERVKEYLEKKSSE